MTWEQFKQHVDMQLLRQGRDDSIEIDYIDVRNPEVLVTGKEDASRLCPFVHAESRLVVGQ